VKVTYRGHIFGYVGNQFIFGYAWISKNVQNNVKNEANDKGLGGKDLGLHYERAWRRVAHSNG
jgi:hypothetical protein